MSLSEPRTACLDAIKQPPTVKELLRRYLDLFWLRPENAFWTVLRSLDVAAGRNGRSVGGFQLRGRNV